MEVATQNVLSGFTFSISLYQGFFSGTIKMLWTAIAY